MEISFEIPGCLPVMTLPNIAFFPQALMPLYIHEERYKEMLQEVLETHRMFILAGINPERLPLTLETDPCFNIATVGIIRACRSHEDGTYHLLLHGLSRIRMTEILEDKSFREAHIEPLLSIKDIDDQSLEQKRQVLRSLLHRKAEYSGAIPKEVLQHIDKVEDSEVYADLTSFSAVDHAPTKQDLLGTLNLGERYDKLISHLTKELEEAEEE